jgi:hypothetical protein
LLTDDRIGELRLLPGDVALVDGGGNSYPSFARYSAMGDRR